MNDPLIMVALLIYVCLPILFMVGGVVSLVKYGQGYGMRAIGLHGTKWLRGSKATNVDKLTLFVMGIMGITLAIGLFWYWLKMFMSYAY